MGTWGVTNAEFGVRNVECEKKNKELGRWGNTKPNEEKKKMGGWGDAVLRRINQIAERRGHPPAPGLTGQ